MASPGARLRCLAKNLSHPCTFSLTPHTKVSILYPESNHFSTLSNESKPPTSFSYCYSSFIPYPLTNSTLSHGHSFFQHFKLISAWEHLRLPYRLARNVLFSELKRLSCLLPHFSKSVLKFTSGRPSLSILPKKAPSAISLSLLQDTHHSLDVCAYVYLPTRLSQFHESCLVHLLFP